MHKIRIKGYPVHLNEQSNSVIIYDYQNKLEKSESVGIMMYLEEEGFLDEFEHVKEKPIKVHIQKIKF